MTTLPLTKTLSPNDFALLRDELALVDAVGTVGQTPEARRWEYAMALRVARAYRQLTQRTSAALLAYDVGGAGSAFPQMLLADQPYFAYVVDAGAQGARAYPMDLSTFVQQHPPLADAVFCLSVLEHVDDLDQFLYHLGCLVAPGGLLFLTMDCWDGTGKDTAHFHWDRQRIFSMADWADLVTTWQDFVYFGLGDWRYHGHQLYASYSVASLALVKRT